MKPRRDSLCEWSKWWWVINEKRWERLCIAHGEIEYGGNGYRPVKSKQKKRGKGR